MISHHFLDYYWTSILRAFADNPLIGFSLYFVGKLIMGLPWPDWILVTLYWIPIVLWPLISGVVSTHFWTIRWSDLTRNWWDHSWWASFSLMMTSSNGTLSALLAFVRGIHRSPVNFPHKGQWRRALRFSLICAWTHDCANSCDSGDLKRHRTYYDVIVMC